MISCADFLSEISNYIEHDIAADVRVQLERHLSHCRSCTVLVDSTRKAIHVVTESESFDLPENIFKPIAERIMDRIQKNGYK